MSTSVIAACVHIGITLGLPLAFLLWLVIKKHRWLRPFGVGVLTFLVSQLLTRIPLLSFLSGQAWFIAFSVAHPLLYSTLLGFTAGLFEEVGRWLFIGWLLKQQRGWSDGLVFGIGHGGLEACMVGANILAMLVAAPNLLLSSPPWEILLGAAERILAVALQVGLSVMVMRGLAGNKKQPLYLLLAILIHTLVDTSIGFFQYFGWSVYMLEILFAFVAAATLLYTLFARKTWPLPGTGQIPAQEGET